MPIPESASDLKAQVTAMKDGRKKAVLITEGANYQAPAGFKTSRIDEGLVVYKDPKVLQQILREGLGSALGYGTPDRINSDYVTTARDKDGNNLSDINSDGRPSIMKAARKLAGSNGTVEFRPAKDAIQERLIKLLMERK